MRTLYPRISRICCALCLLIMIRSLSGDTRLAMADFHPASTSTTTPRRDTPPPESDVAGIDALDNLIGIQEKLSSMGFSTDAAFDAFEPAVAYNSRDHTFLVVWSGADSTAGDYEIWGQRVDAVTMGQIGADFQISTTGTAGDTSRSAESPDVAYNPATNEFLVVWQADALTDNRYEILGRMVNGSTGGLVGFTNRISMMEPDGNVEFDAKSPAVAYNSLNNQFAVVWWADTNMSSLVDNENEIWARRVFGGGGSPIGSQVRISDMGGLGDENYDAQYPDISYNSSNNQFLVVWESDETLPVFQDDDYEIWGQCLTYTLTDTNTNDFLISDMGAPTEHWADAQRPAVTYNTSTEQYLVVWHGDDDVDEKYDIYGQIVNSACFPTVSNDFLISEAILGPNPAFDALMPDVTWNALFNEYLVVFMADKAGVGEFEIWSQRIDSGANLIKHNIPVSIMGPAGDTNYAGAFPAVAYSDKFTNLSLITWYGDHTVNNKLEVWSRRFGGLFKVLLPAALRK